MILSDNETKLDLLNNRAIAKTIVDIIMDSEESVSIGVHGDWGAGKSSILAMIEDEIDVANATAKEAKPKFEPACVRFNGWQHQGFEDSKVALMSAIVTQLTELAEKHVVKEGISKVKETGKKLWKNINWLSVAKKVGTIGFSLATGTAPLTILTSAFESLKGHADSKEHIGETIEAIGEYLQSAGIGEDTSSLKEFNEFRENFKNLLEQAEITKLIVIIDDLDRCLPDVAIDTLEAIRLFMFMKETAFVIGADEAMIRYAVKKHFPDFEKESGVNIGDSFADKYLEKLIQIPFRIPVLGPVESQLYTILLMVGSVNDVSEAAYEKLINTTLAKLKTPWEDTFFGITDVQESIGNDEYKKVANNALIAIQISPLLYQYSRGNPRVIKRFINMLLLRHTMAVNKGYGKELDLQVLAKLMLAEKKWPLLYEKIAFHLVNGISQELAYCEDKYGTPTDKDAGNDGKTTKDKKGEAVSGNKSPSKRMRTKEKTIDISWIESEEYRPWITSEPHLKGKDLRPYYTACKEKIDYFGKIDSDEDLREAVDILMKDEGIVVSKTDRIKALSEENAIKAFDIVSENVMLSGDLSEEPVGFIGLKFLTELHPGLRKRLVEFVSALPPDKLGEWIVTGWEKAIPVGCDEEKQLDAYFDRLETEGTDWVKQSLKIKREK